MHIEEKMCYSRLVFMMCQGEEWEQAVHKVSYTHPLFSFEGIAGYIETKVSFEVADLVKFTELWSRWYVLPESIRLNWYAIVANKQGANSCK